MKYDEIVEQCEALEYRDKLRLAQLLLQLGRKEEEIQNPEKRNNLETGKSELIDVGPTENISSIQYVIDRIAKLRPAKKKALLNSIRAMYQFQGAISDEDQEAIVLKLEKAGFLKVQSDNRVVYL